MTAGDVEVIKGTINSYLAASFDGTDDELQINAHAVARNTANDTVGTYSFWFMPDNITGTYGLIACGDAIGGAAETLLIQQAADDIRIYCRRQAGAGFDIITTNAALVTNEWVHVAVVQNGTRPIIYINGLAVAMTDTVGTVLAEWFATCTGLDEARIGCRTLSGAEDQFLLGVMGPVKYWSTDLSSDSVAREAGINPTSNTSGEQAILDAALEENWAWDGLLTSSGGDATTASIVGHAYLSGWSSQWSRAVEIRGYTNVGDFMNTFRDGNEYVTIVVQGA